MSKKIFGPKKIFVPNKTEMLELSSRDFHGDNIASDWPNSPRQDGWNYCDDCLANQRQFCPHENGGRLTLASLFLIFNSFLESVLFIKIIVSLIKLIVSCENAEVFSRETALSALIREQQGSYMGPNFWKESDFKPRGKIGSE